MFIRGERKYKNLRMLETGGERSINSKMNKSVPFSEIILKGKLELVSKAAKIRENIGVTILGNRAK